MTNSKKSVHQALLNALIEFTHGQDHRAMQPFKEEMQNWGEDWIDVPSAQLPAREWLTRMAPRASPGSEKMVRLFEQYRDALCWEQSYTREDGVVGEEMLRAYGFSEIVGKQGPFLSERVRSGIGVWGPGITYPIHRHQGRRDLYRTGRFRGFHGGRRFPPRMRSGRSGPCAIDDAPWVQDPGGPRGSLLHLAKWGFKGNLDL